MACYPMEQQQSLARRLRVQLRWSGRRGPAVPDEASLNPQSLTIDAWVFPVAVDGQIDIIVNKEMRTAVDVIQYEIGIRGTQPGTSQSIPTGNFAFYLLGTPHGVR